MSAPRFQHVTPAFRTFCGADALAALPRELDRVGASRVVSAVTGPNATPTRSGESGIRRPVSGWPCSTPKTCQGIFLDPGMGADRACDARAGVGPERVRDGWPASAAGAGIKEYR
jgi:hypothetical protein